MLFHTLSTLWIMHWLCCLLLLSGIKTISCSELLSPSKFISFFHHLFFNSHCINQHQDLPPQMWGNEIIVQGQNHKTFKEILRSLKNKSTQSSWSQVIHSQTACLKKDWFDSPIGGEIKHTVSQSQCVHLFIVCASLSSAHQTWHWVWTHPLKNPQTVLQD